MGGRSGKARKPGIPATVQRALSSISAHLSKVQPRFLPPITAALDRLADVGRRRATGGRPQVEIDLDEVRRLARLGMWQTSKIARCLGIHRNTLSDSKHRESVLDAIEDGRALFEMDALQGYARIIEDGGHPAQNALHIFKMKQVGWSDSPKAGGPGGGPPDDAGARANLKELVLKWRAQHKEQPA